RAGGLRKPTRGVERLGQRDVRTGIAPLSLALVEGLATNDEEAVFAAFVREHSRENRGLWTLTLIERLLPNRIGPDSTPSLRALLATLHDELSGASVLPR
ncbi:MAG: hypothetical protein AAFZ65_06455, partial [Planctomycetota bacterium]